MYCNGSSQLETDRTDCAVGLRQSFSLKFLSLKGLGDSGREEVIHGPPTCVHLTLAWPAKISQVPGTKRMTVASGQLVPCRGDHASHRSSEDSEATRIVDQDSNTLASVPLLLLHLPPKPRPPGSVSTCIAIPPRCAALPGSCLVPHSPSSAPHPHPSPCGRCIPLASTTRTPSA